MSALRFFIWHRETIDSNAAIRRLIVLRLTMLLVVLGSLLIWNFIIGAYEHWLFTALIFLAIAIWSVAVFSNTTLQGLRHAELREILIDIGWVFIVVFIAGRTTNPFIYYYLVLTAISATLLSSRKAWFICGLSVLLYSTMMVLDVKAHFAHFSADYKIHLVGMWVNYVGSSIVICLFVTKLINALRVQQRKLTQIRENNLQSEQLIALATVSASTVHNLATPLSTLTLLTDELASSKDLDKELQKDLYLMKQQIIRCRDNMRDLSSLAEQSDRTAIVSVSELLADLKEHCALHFPNRNLDLVFLGSEEQILTSKIECSALFEYALINLINNAMESSQSFESAVSMKVSCVNSQLIIAIQNDCDDSLEMLAERWGKPSSSDKEAGLGIGTLLANSTIERQGGTVMLEVTSSQARGLAESNHNLAIVTVTFPLYESDTKSTASSGT